MQEEANRKYGNLVESIPLRLKQIVEKKQQEVKDENETEAERRSCDADEAEEKQEDEVEDEKNWKAQLSPEFDLIFCTIFLFKNFFSIKFLRQNLKIL